MVLIRCETRRDTQQLRIGNSQLLGRERIAISPINSWRPGGAAKPRRGATESGSGDVLRVRALHASRHVSVAVINFVNLLHAGERFFRFADPRINDA
jgi:hypothetical protein